MVWSHMDTQCSKLIDRIVKLKHIEFQKEYCQDDIHSILEDIVYLMDDIFDEIRRPRP